jgi:hypothetical protein
VGLKIKWNDDRVRAATTAILLIGRDRLSGGHTENLVQESLAEFRTDPERYKKNRTTWADVNELGPLTNPAHVAYYKNLILATDVLLRKMEQGRRQSNSLLELDNFLVSSLRNVR